MSSIINPSEQHPAVTRGQIPSRRLITLMGLGHLVWALLLFYVLLKTWPPETPNNHPMYFFSPISILRFELTSGTLEQRLLFMVILLGALGSLIHAIISFTTYVGNRKFLTSWTWWYLLRPFVGAALALALYFVVRSGILTTNNTPESVSRFGMAMLAIMSGLFAKQATDKLEEVFSTFFKPGPGKGDAQRGDKLVPPAITSLTPNKGPAGKPVKIIGTGFVDKASVTFGNVAASGVVVESSTSITATPPKHAPGAVPVVVQNPDGAQTTAQFTYTEETTTPGGGPALTITALTPNEGPAVGATEVKITGTGFVDKATVQFGEAAATTAVVESATAIKAITPQHAPGTVTLTVKNPDGREATSKFKFI